jgi:hypothetical protein
MADGDSIDDYLCDKELFKLFLSSNFSSLKFTDVEVDELRIAFAKYLFGMNLNEKQKENILPKSKYDVLINCIHPLRINGFPPAYMLHFTEFIDKAQKVINDE